MAGGRRRLEGGEVWSQCYRKDCGLRGGRVKELRSPAATRRPCVLECGLPGTVRCQCVRSAPAGHSTDPGPLSPAGPAATSALAYFPSFHPPSNRDPGAKRKGWQ